MVKDTSQGERKVLGPKRYPSGENDLGFHDSLENMDPTITWGSGRTLMTSYTFTLFS